MTAVASPRGRLHRLSVSADVCSAAKRPFWRFSNRTAISARLRYENTFSLDTGCNTDFLKKKEPRKFPVALCSGGHLHSHIDNQATFTTAFCLFSQPLHAMDLQLQSEPIGTDRLFMTFKHILTPSLSPPPFPSRLYHLTCTIL